MRELWIEIGRVLRKGTCYSDNGGNRDDEFAPTRSLVFNVQSRVAFHKNLIYRLGRVICLHLALISCCVAPIGR